MIDTIRCIASGFLFLFLSIGTAACDGEFTLAGFTADEVFADPVVERLARAAVQGDLAEMDAAVAAGADVNYQGKQKVTPLFWTLGSKNRAGFEKLVQLGADPFIQDHKTRTVAAMAAGSSDPAYLEILLKNGMDPNHPEGHQQRPILFEAVMHERWPQIELLLMHCADLHWATQGGITIGTYASSSHHHDKLIRLLEEGYQYNLNSIARMIQRREINEKFEEAIARRDQVIEMLKDRGVRYPTEINTPPPSAPPRQPPLYARSCLERRAAQ